jgi:hypothetical protein
MRFMMLVLPKGYVGAEPQTVPDPERVKQMLNYNQELLDSGVLRAMDGLEPPTAGARVTYDTGKPVVKDGPFAEAKEVLGGYWLIEVASLEEAVGWAKRAPMSADETIEVRKVHDYEEWPAETKESIDQFLKLREQAEARR